MIITDNFKNKLLIVNDSKIFKSLLFSFLLSIILNFQYFLIILNPENNNKSCIFIILYYLSFLYKILKLYFLKIEILSLFLIFIFLLYIQI